MYAFPRLIRHKESIHCGTYIILQWNFSARSLIVPSLRLCDSATFGTLADRFVVNPILDDRFKLCAEVRAVERVFADDGGLLVLARLAVPA